MIAVAGMFETHAGFGAFTAWKRRCVTLHCGAVEVRKKFHLPPLLRVRLCRAGGSVAIRQT
jgi:hypothetical protein